MQLIKRLGPQALPVTQQACNAAAGGFNCSANLTVTVAPGGGGGYESYEALLVNHPTGVVSMRPPNAPTLPPVNVTLVFKGGKGGMPRQVSVRRVDATHANAIPAYEAMGRPQYPNASAITALKAASALVVEQVTPVAGTGAAAGLWSVTMEMAAFSVASLSF